jgi:hypothetical protein
MKNKYIYEFVFWDPIKNRYRIWVYSQHFAPSKEPLLSRLERWYSHVHYWLESNVGLHGGKIDSDTLPVVEEARKVLGDVSVLSLRRVVVIMPNGSKKELFVPTAGIAADTPGYFGFVHPTKNGGSTIERHLYAHYPEFIAGGGHDNTVASVIASGKTPIVPIRQPVGRFLSMYTYWRNGASSGPFKRPKDWNPVVKNASEFLVKWQNKDPKLLDQMTAGFTWDIHFASQKKWFTKKEWNKAIVLIYHPDRLHENFSLLLQNLGVPPATETLSKINPSADKKALNLTEEASQILRKKFAYDFELWDTLQNHPSKFKKVIGHFPL